MVENRDKIIIILLLCLLAINISLLIISPPERPRPTPPPEQEYGYYESLYRESEIEYARQLYGSGSNTNTIDIGITFIGFIAFLLLFSLFFITTGPNSAPPGEEGAEGKPGGREREARAS